MRRWIPMLVVGAFLAAAAARSLADDKPAGPKRWENAIAQFEAADAKHPPAPGGVVFVGSSSIRLWKLPVSFPKLHAVNRGFGGSQMEDSLYYADRIIIPYAPRTVVLYAGDNDIAAKKTPEQVCDDFKALVKQVQAALPETRILYLPIKPSLKRWALVDKMKRANALIHKFIETDSRLEYVDTFTPMLGEDGKPRKELFAQDGLHLNDEGYRLWTKQLKPYLKQAGSKAK